MDVKLVKEHEDGSATFTFNLTPIEAEMLLINGIRAALLAGIEQGKEWHDSEVGMGNTTRGCSGCSDGSCK